MSFHFHIFSKIHKPLTVLKTTLISRHTQSPFPRHTSTFMTLVYYFSKGSGWSLKLTVRHPLYLSRSLICTPQDHRCIFYRTPPSDSKVEPSQTPSLIVVLKLPLWLLLLLRINFCKGKERLSFHYVPIINFWFCKIFTSCLFLSCRVLERFALVITVKPLMWRPKLRDNVTNKKTKSWVWKLSKEV